MPVYKFKCDKCREIFEKSFHMGDDMSGMVCPECHSDRVHRLITVPYVEFKGKGFYVNDKLSKTDKEAVNDSA